METQSSYSNLQNSIQLLEEEQAIKRRLLEDQLNLSFDSLKPLNLLSSALNDISSSPDLRNNILGTTIGLASGFLTKKVFIGASGNILRRLIGSFIQLGVTNIVAKHPKTIRAIGQFIIGNFLSGKETNSGNRVK